MKASPPPADFDAYWLEFTSPQDALRHVESAPAELAGPMLKLEGIGPETAAALRRLLAELGGALLPARAAPAAAARRDFFLAAGAPPAARAVLARLAERLRREVPDAAAMAAAADAIEDCLRPRRRTLRVGSRVLDFERKAHVMGILNRTPDSFYPGSRVADSGGAVSRALEMVAAGADILDIGGESTRPDALPVDPREEAQRVVPLIRGIRRESDVPISVDTRHADVARQALEAGADLINDVSGLAHDPRMAALAAGRDVPVVIMHMRGDPQTMQSRAEYADTVSEVIRELRAAVRAALAAGVSPERIVVDPGIGFSKSGEDNLRILKHLGSFASLGFPLLVGLSRKSFLGHVTGRPVEGRLAATIAAHVLALLGGADILRVHDVAEAVEAVKVVEAVRRADG